MGFRSGSYAKVWSIEPGKGNFTKVRLSISRKNKEGEYEQDFSGFCMFIGTANANSARLREGDRIKLGDVDVCNTYDKTTKKEYVNYKVFTFDMADGAPTQQAEKPKPSPVEEPTEGATNEDDLPF